MATKYTPSDYTKSLRTFSGAIKTINIGVDCGATGLTELADILGKGTIVGGAILPTKGVAQFNSTVLVQLDTSILFWKIFADAYDWGLKPPANYPLRITAYDRVNDIYGFDFQTGLSFENRLKIQYWEMNNVPVRVYINLLYTLFE